MLSIISQNHIYFEQNLDLVVKEVKDLEHEGLQTHALLGLRSFMQQGTHFWCYDVEREELRRQPDTGFFEEIGSLLLFGF